MLKNKKVKIVISLVMAVLLWAYVIGEVNPSAKEIIRNVPISFAHTDMLAERGLAISAVSAEKIDIEVTGSRAEIKNFNPQDIQAYVDMSSAAKGENELSISVRVPSGISVTGKSMGKISVSVEPLTSKTVDVSIMYTGTFAEHTEGTTIAISHPQVTVSGAESLVNIVEYARGTINASRVKTEETDITCELQPVNADGTPVDRVSLSQREAKVTSILSETKSVKLTVAVTDNSSDDSKRTTKAPESVLIAGRADKLRGVTAIAADTVDISNIAESTEIPLEFSHLPEGVFISDSNVDMVLKLTVEGQTNRKYTFTPDEINIDGKNSKFNYELSPDFKVEVMVRAVPDDLADIQKEILKVSVDVSQIKEEGSYELPVKVTCSSKADLTMTPSPDRALIKAEKKTNN
jgi:YbbR domain-containing protein